MMRTGERSGAFRPLASRLSVYVMTVAVLASPVFAARSAEFGSPRFDTTSGGIIAFRDVRGIGVIDPRSGHERMLFVMSPACSSSASGVPPMDVSAPVWAPSTGTAPQVYFWLTDYVPPSTSQCRIAFAPSSLESTAQLVRANPVTGTLRIVAIAPRGLPCQPGIDLVTSRSALGFTSDGCDESTIEALRLPLRSGETPSVPSAAPSPPGFCRGCAINFRVMGPGPQDTVVVEEYGLQTPSPPTPLLQLFNPVTGSLTRYSPPLPLSTRTAALSVAASPNGREVAVAAGKSGAGVL